MAIDGLPLARNERNGARIAALVARRLVILLCLAGFTIAAALCPAGLATLGVAQGLLFIEFLLSLGELKGCSAVGTIDGHIRHTGRGRGLC